MRNPGIVYAKMLPDGTQALVLDIGEGYVGGVCSMTHWEINFTRAPWHQADTRINVLWLWWQYVQSPDDFVQERGDDWSGPRALSEPQRLLTRRET